MRSITIIEPPASLPARRRQSTRISMSLTSKGILSFHNIHYRLHRSRLCCKSKSTKHIINNVSGLFTPGMNAIMGNSPSSTRSPFFTLSHDRSDRMRQVITLGHSRRSKGASRARRRCARRRISAAGIVQVSGRVRRAR